MLLVNNNPHPAHHSKKHAIPALLDINPYEEFEFSFPAQTMWWDDSSDFSPSDDEQPANLAARLAQYRPVENTLSVMLQKPNPYQIHFATIPTIAAIPESIEEEKDFIDKIIATVAQAAPKSIYKKRKFAMKRRRKCRKRKHRLSEQIEPEFRSIWTHSNVGDLFVTAKAGSPSADPPPSLPTINLNEINKNMLKRIDVVKLPIQGCSPDPKFYTETVVTDSVDYYGRPHTLESSHWKSEPFGSLPAVLTDVGPVALPDEPFFGHTWSGDKWIVKAEYPPPLPRDPGGRHARGRDDGRRPERGGQGGGQRQRGGRGER